MSNRVIRQIDPELKSFFAFAKQTELSIIKSGRSEPTNEEIEFFASAYWQAVDRLRRRLLDLGVDQPATDPVVQKFLELTLRCEAAWRSRIKPRGYSGDYRLMELLYELGRNDEAETHSTESMSPGQKLVEAAFAKAHGIRLVQRRARLLEAYLVGRIAQSQSPIKILDVGGGGAPYFRRALVRVNNKCISYTIIDQDASLPNFWQKKFPKYVSKKVRVVVSPLRKLLQGGHPELVCQRFDLILSAGLFDHIEQDNAQALANHLFALLRTDGRLLITNMLDSEPPRAAFFRETLMDWKIVKRSDAQMQALIPTVNAEKYQRFTDVDLGVVTYTRH